MKTVITTLNAKYIHRSLAVRLLYVANRDRFDISYKEYTIKEDLEQVAQDLLSDGSDCIGIGVYIWNVNKVAWLVSRIREINPQVKIILGGPEVSYEPAHFLQQWNIDFVISGEGEFVLGELLHALENNLPVTISGVSSAGSISTDVVRADLEKVAGLPSPYRLEEDKESMQHQLIYFETSRGCPYRCSYCLSSLEKGVRYFPHDYITDNLQYLITHGARQVKFLDRTFNLNKKHTRMIFDFLIRNYRPGLVFQFEIYADLLDDELIEWLHQELPANFFRFEIGIQSTFDKSNTAVNRKQDFPLLSGNIRRLMEKNRIDLHLDLIAGLPHETFGRFIQSFDAVFSFGAKEVQLGFLKLLRGTRIREKSADFGYEFNETAPYEVICNDSITHDEVIRIKNAENMLDIYWNSGRFTLTMSVLFRTGYQHRYFAFFDEMAQYCKNMRYLFKKYQLEDLFRYLNDFLQSRNMNLLQYLQEDYYNNFRMRPARSFYPTVGKDERKKVLNQVSRDREFLDRHQLTVYAIQKQTALDRISPDEFMLTVFSDHGKKRLIYHP